MSDRIRIAMTATFDAWTWNVDDEGNPEPEPDERGGFTNPANPWGGFHVEVPQTENPSREWYRDNVETVEFHSIGDAARFAVEFPGSVWDLWDSDPEQDYRTGEWMSVTLHVEDSPYREQVLAVAARMMAVDDKRRARVIARQYPNPNRPVRVLP